MICYIRARQVWFRLFFFHYHHHQTSVLSYYTYTGKIKVSHFSSTIHSTRDTTILSLNHQTQPQNIKMAFSTTDSRPSAFYSHRPSTSTQRSTSSTSSIKSVAQSVKKAMNSSTEDYWSRPHPLYNPRPSVVKSRNNSVSSTGSAESKSSLKKKVKKALDRSAEEYWGNAEMNAYYGNAGRK